MKSFPSNRIMFATLLILVLWFGFKFIASAKEHFFQLNFDWDNVTESKDLGEVSIDSISYNYLGLNLDHEITTSAQNTYRLSAGRSNYYFRYDYAVETTLKLEFKGIEWITGQPELTKQKAHLTEINISLIQTEGPSIITLGDHLLRKNEAKYFRKELRKGTPLVFKGRFKDVFNFPHEAVDSNTSTTIVSQLDEIEKAEYYILFFGTNDTVLSSEEIQNNIATIFKTFLSDTTTKQVFIILLPPSVNSEVNAHAINYNTMILEAVNDRKIKVINTMTLFENKLDNYLRKDGISISKSGYQKLANVIIKNLE
jgi:hypothetical protein